MSEPDNDFKFGVDRDDPYTWDEMVILAAIAVIGVGMVAGAAALAWWLLRAIAS